MYYAVRNIFVVHSDMYMLWNWIYLWNGVLLYMRNVKYM